MNNDDLPARRPRTRRLAAFLVAAVALALTTVAIVPASPAAAAPCSGYGCDGSDPIATGCASGTVTNTATAYISNGAGQHLAYLELRYSVGCGTNWGRITRSGSGNYLSVYVYRPSPAASTYAYGGTGSSYYGDQLYGSGLTVCAVGQATDSTNPQSPTYSATICG